MSTLSEVIEERLSIKPKPLDIWDEKIEILRALESQTSNDPRAYSGFDMSGYGFGDDERTDFAMNKCRIDNWLLFINNFRDYLSIKVEDFKLFSWKGTVWWGDENSYGNEKDGCKDFTGASTHEIVEWIIKTKGGIYEAK